MQLQLFVRAYNMGNFLRRLALPTSMKHWTLTTLLMKLIKTGAKKVVHHAQYVIFQMAEMAVSRKVFATILAQMRRFTAVSPRPAPI